MLLLQTFDGHPDKQENKAPLDDKVPSQGRKALCGRGCNEAASRPCSGFLEGTLSGDALKGNQGDPRRATEAVLGCPLQSKPLGLSFGWRNGTLTW